MQFVTKFYNRYPRLAPLVFNPPLFGLSDYLSQRLEASESKELQELDLRRIVAVSACAPFFNGGPLVIFYEKLDKHLGKGADARTAFKKVLGVQLIYLPLSTPLFVLLSNLFHRTLVDAMDLPPREAWGNVPRHLSSSWDRAVAKWPETYGASWFVWPVSDMINFTLMQRWCPAFRTTWDGLIGVLWNTYLCWAGLGDRITLSWNM